MPCHAMPCHAMLPVLLSKGADSHRAPSSSWLRSAQGSTGAPLLRVLGDTSTPASCSAPPRKSTRRLAVGPHRPAAAAMLLGTHTHRLLSRSLGLRNNASSSFTSSIQRPALTKQCLQRLNDSFNQVSSSSQISEKDAIEVLNDLKTLHEQHCVIPKHFIAHGYRLAASAKQNAVLHELTRLAIDNHSFVPDESLKETLSIGMKQAVSASMFTDALTMWEEARKFVPLSHTDTKQLVDYVHETKGKYENQDFVSKLLQSNDAQTFRGMYNLYHKQTGVLLYAHLNDAQDANNALPRRDIMLDRSTDSLLRLLSMQSDAEYNSERAQILNSNIFRSRLRNHLRILAQTGRFNEALRCLDALLSCYAVKTHAPHVPATAAGLLGHVSTEEVAQLDDYFFSNSKTPSLSGKMWAHDMLLHVLYTSGQVTVHKSRRVRTRSELMTEHLDRAARTLHLAKSYSLPADLRLIHSFLESVQTRIQREVLVEDSFDQEQAVFAPVVRGLREGLEGLASLSMKQLLTQSLVKLLLTKPSVQTMSAATHALDWCMIRFPVLPSTMSAVCKEGSVFFKAHKLSWLDGKVTQWMDMHHATYKTEGARIAAFPGRFALKQALKQELGMLTLLREQLQMSYNVGKSYFVDTVTAFQGASSTTIREVQEMQRFFREVGHVVDWFHYHMTKHSKFEALEAVASLLPLFVKAAETNVSNVAAIDHAAEGLEKYLKKHWVVTDKKAWTKEDEAVLAKVCQFYCKAGRVDIGEERLVTLQAAFPKHDVVCAATIEPFVVHHIQVEGNFAAGEDLVTKHLVNHNKPLNRGLVDCLVSAVLNNGEPRDALDLAQELYNQHHVPVSFKLLVAMLFHSKRKNDLFEAARVSDFAVTLYGQRMVDTALKNYDAAVAVDIPKEKRPEHAEKEFSPSFW